MPETFISKILKEKFYDGVTYKEQSETFIQSLNFLVTSARVLFRQLQYPVHPIK